MGGLSNGVKRWSLLHGIEVGAFSLIRLKLLILQIHLPPRSFSQYTNYIKK